MLMHPIDLTQNAFYSIAHNSFPSRTTYRKAYLHRNVHPYLFPRYDPVDQPNAAHGHGPNALRCAIKEGANEVLPLQPVRLGKALGAGGIRMGGLLLPGLHGENSSSLAAAPVAHGQPLPTPRTAARQQLATVLRRHARAEPMRVGALPPARLVRTFAH